MLLNAAIIFERLKQKYPVKMYGNPDPLLSLHFPEIYMDNTLHFYENHIYLATVEHLPHRPHIEKNVVLVCIGENPRLSYYKEHAVVILIGKKADFFQVYKTLQEIYELFGSWESRLLKLLVQSPSVQELLDCSWPLFRRSMFVLNASFQYVASISSAESKNAQAYINPARGNLSADAFLSYLKEKDLNMEEKSAFFLEMEADNFLCVNLFSLEQEYIGCLYIELEHGSCVAGEEQLAQFLAEIIERVAENTPMLLKNEQGSLKKALLTLMKELPLSQNQRMLLKSANRRKDYHCVSFHYLKRFSSLPVAYICAVLEDLFPDSLFFEYDNTILGLICAEDPHHPDARDQLIRKLAPFTEEINLSAGVSNVFQDLYLLRTYYQQAESALENGQLYRPDQQVYFFSDYMLDEIIASSFGGFPMETFFPAGFRILLEHDRASETSYLETLSVYLEENMSVSRASRRLYIHRSTLLERLSRIRQDLSCDLENPDQRLQLQIILKALRTNRKIEERQTEKQEPGP